MKTHVTIKGVQFELKKPVIVKQAYVNDEMVDAFVHIGSDSEWNKLLLALDESEPEQKPFSVENPPENEQACWHIEIINGSAYVYESFFIKDSRAGSKLLSTGNLFRTREEAEAVLKRVLQALKS